MNTHGPGVVPDLADDTEYADAKRLFAKRPASVIYHAICENLTVADAQELAELVIEAARESMEGDEARAGQILFKTIRRWIRENA